MTQNTAAGPWEDILPLDVVSPRSREHLGLLYPGEAVFARSWQSEWGSPLTGERYFRIVLLDQPLKHEVPTPNDSRTAICVPAAGTSRNLDRLGKELETIRHAAYLTRHSADAATVAKSLQERRSALAGQLTEERRSLFAGGAIKVKSGASPDPAWVFSDACVENWLDRLSGWLLDQAYQGLPVNFGAGATTLGRPLHGGDAAATFAALFGHSGADSHPLDHLIPALEAANVSGLLRARTAGLGGTVSYAEVHRHLAHNVGLTGPWANLFLLLFLREERPELEVRLTAPHGITLADGRPLLSDRLTGDVVASLAWPDDLALHADTIGPLSAPSFAGALQHLAAICPQVVLEDQVGAQDLLTRRLLELHDEAARSQDFLERLSMVASQIGPLNNGAPGEPTPAQAVSKIGAIKGASWPLVYQSIRETYTDLLQLEADLETVAQLGRHSRHSQEIFAALAYLAGAQVPADAYPGLSVDRQALWAVLSPASLVDSLEKGRSWEAVSRELASFKESYAGYYRRHHQGFYDALPQYQSEVEGANLKLRALGLLNTLPELGPPAGEGLEREMPGSLIKRAQCPQQAGALEITDSPVCPECQLTLAESLQTGQLVRLLPRVDRSLSAKTRALSGQLAGKVMNHGIDARMGDFLAIVQASELSGLANTLDEDLLGFVKRVLD